MDAIVDSLLTFANARNQKRINAHLDFVKHHRPARGGFKYTNLVYRFPVMTRHEIDIFISPLKTIEKVGKNEFEVRYSTQHSHLP
jgi:hypothetical protein